MLAVTLATHNEKSNLMKYFSSYYDIADEIVVVDGESTDGTVEALREMDHAQKLHILSTKNVPNFHTMKQMANDAVKEEWILQMDADEALSPELKKEILETIKNPGTYNGFWMPRVNYFLGRPLWKGGQYPDKTIRLYRGKKGRLPCKSVHEQAEVDGDVGDLKANLVHHPYPTFGDYIHKWVRYASLEAHNAYKKGKRPTLLGGIQSCLIKPSAWFLKTYVRHKGFQDGFAGFVFSLFSGLRFMLEYVFLCELALGVKRK